MTTSPGVSAPSGGPPKEYRITAHARAGGLAAAGTTSIDLDTTWGGTPTGLPGPAEVLATAFAACLADEQERRIVLPHRNVLSYETVFNTLVAVCDVHGEMVPVPPAHPSTMGEVQ